MCAARIKLIFACYLTSYGDYHAICAISRILPQRPQPFHRYRKKAVSFTTDSRILKTFSPLASASPKYPSHPLSPPTLTYISALSPAHIPASLWSSPKLHSLQTRHASYDNQPLNINPPLHLFSTNTERPAQNTILNNVTRNRQNSPPSTPSDPPEEPLQTKSTALHIANTTYYRFITCNCRSLSTLPRWELLKSAFAIRSNDIILLNETRCPEAKLQKVFGTKHYVPYACSDNQRPNGSGCAILIPKELASSVQGVWSHLGYAKIILLASTSPLLIIAIYKPYTNSGNLLYKDEKMSSFLALHIAKARRSRWRVIIGGDFNSRPEDEDLDSDNQSPARRRDNALHNFLNRQGLVDAWVCTNPDHPGYTHHTPSLNTVSRIDYVYCSHNFRDSIRLVSLLETSNFTLDHNLS
jgi:exonuclease III